MVIPLFFSYDKAWAVSAGTTPSAVTKVIKEQTNLLVVFNITTSHFT